MREIKFRAWDKAFNRMVLPEDAMGWKLHFNGCVDYEGSWATGDLELMQFTGLLDRNGTEIYEGDIIHLPACCSQKDCPTETWYEVKVGLHKSNTSYGVFFTDGEEDVSWWHNKDKWYVCGNIYQNPELLK